MLTRNVHYAEQPDEVMLHVCGTKAIVEMPVNVTEVELEEGTEFVAEKVYTLETVNSKNLLDRVLNNKEAWINKAKVSLPEAPTLSDVIEALNALTEIVIGGGE